MAASPPFRGPDPAIAGYSDREFDAIMAAARSDVAAIRSRLERSQRLLTRYEREPDSLSGRGASTRRGVGRHRGYR